MSKKTFNLMLQGPICPKLMTQAIKRCPRPKFFKDMAFSLLFVPMLEGALVAMGGIVLAFMLLNKNHFPQQYLGVAAPLLGSVLAICVMKLSAHVKKILAAEANAEISDLQRQHNF